MRERGKGMSFSRSHPEQDGDGTKEIPNEEKINETHPFEGDKPDWVDDVEADSP